MKNENISIPGLRFELDKYQHVGIDFAIKRRRCLICDIGGLGKTIMSLGIFLRLRGRGEAKNLIVVAPASSLYPTWREEILERTDVEPIVVQGTPKMRKAHYASFGVWTHLLITNYETFRRDYQNDAYKKADIIIFDESTAFKNFNTQTANAARSVARYIPRIVLLTATPIENNLMDIYSAMEVIQPGLLGDDLSFRNYYCLVEKKKTIGRRGRVITVQKIVGHNPNTLDELTEILSPYMLRREPEDVGLKYADTVYREYELDLSEAQQKLCSSLRKGILDEGDRIRRVVLAAKFQYLLLACNSPCLVTKTAYQEGESAKITFLKGMVLELVGQGEKVVIFSRWRMTIDLLERIFRSEGLEVRRVTGKESKQQKGEEVKDFSTRKDVNVMLINLAGAKSLNLQAAHWLIFLDLYLNPATNQQTMWRIHRRNQVSPYVYFISFLMRNTEEQRVKAVLEAKQATSTGFYVRLRLDKEDMLSAVRSAGV